MVSRGILQIFDDYQRSRLIFAQAVAELALRPQNSEILCKAGVVGKHKKHFLIFIELVRLLLLSH